MSTVRDLRNRIRGTWSQLDCPSLPLPEEWDWDYQDLYPHIQDRTWSDIDLTTEHDRALAYDDWIDALPTEEAKVYYFSALLDFCLRFYEDTSLDVDLAYLFLIRDARRLVEYTDALPVPVVSVIADALQFIREHNEEYGYDDVSDVREDLNQTLDCWQSLRKRVGDTDPPPPT